MSNPQDPILDHNYDGIAEMDNKLPRWWVWLFNITIGFSAVYLLFYHVLDLGPLQEAKWKNEVTAAAAPAAAQPGGEGTPAAVAPAVEEPSTDAAVLARGKELFTINCVVCHGQNGQGLIGPNLCDEYFIHGPQFADSLHTIREGVLAKGMISWKAVLKPEDILAVGSYIYSLRGTNPPEPKAPEGTKAEAPATPSA